MLNVIEPRRIEFARTENHVQCGFSVCPVIQCQDDLLNMMNDLRNRADLIADEAYQLVHPCPKVYLTNCTYLACLNGDPNS